MYELNHKDPCGQQASEKCFQDESKEFEEIMQILPLPSNEFNNVSVNHSNEVHFGDIFKFEGPVTLLKNTPGATIDYKDKSGVYDEGKDNEVESHMLRCQRSQKWCLTLAGLVSVVLVISIYYSARLTNKESAGENVNSTIYTRASWNARKPARVAMTLKSPVPYVMILRTETSNCDTFEQCSEMIYKSYISSCRRSNFFKELRCGGSVKWLQLRPYHQFFKTQKIADCYIHVVVGKTFLPFKLARLCYSVKIHGFQDYHIDIQKFEDISFNFLIGGDGGIYKGRGWGKAGQHTLGYNHRSIGICLIGNFDVEGPFPPQIAATQALIQMGVEKGKLSPEYQLLGQQQVKATKSPGKLLFALIKTWPHFNASVHFSN